MESYIYQGVLTGLALCFLVGPLFFALLDAGLHNGLRGGILLGTGIWVSDFSFLTVIWFQISFIRSIAAGKHFSLIVGILGGLVLIITGILGYIRSRTIHTQTHIKLPSSAWALWFKGFLTNTLNPFTVFFWLTVVGNFAADSNHGPIEGSIFFGALLGTVIATDILKVLLARQISHWLNPTKLQFMSRVISIVLIAFGFILIFRVL